MINFFPNIVSDLAPLGNILFVSASAPTINDSQTRTQALGRIDRPFRTIQSAVNVSTNQDTICIFEGVYNGNINLNCNLVCIGDVILNSNIFILGITDSISITGKQTYINGNITTYIHNIAIYLDVLQINSGLNTTFNGDNNGRFILICNDTRIISNTGILYGVSVLSKFTGCFISLASFSNAVGNYTSCEITCNNISYRGDSTPPSFIGCVINIFGNPNIFIICVFSGTTPYIYNCTFNGSCALLFGNNTLGRFVSIMLLHCDLSRLTITNGIYAFWDGGHGTGSLRIVYCTLKTGTNTYGIVSGTVSTPLSPEIMNVTYI